jgi:hypothetical protein
MGRVILAGMREKVEKFAAESGCDMEKLASLCADFYAEGYADGYEEGSDDLDD